MVTAETVKQEQTPLQQNTPTESPSSVCEKAVAPRATARRICWAYQAGALVTKPRSCTPHPFRASNCEGRSLVKLGLS